MSLQIEVERLDALLQPFAEPVPFAGRQDARNDVERDQPLLGVGLAIDREGDADPAEQQLGLAAPVVEHVGPHLAEPRGQRCIGRAYLPVRSGHLVESHPHRHPRPARPLPNAADRRLFQDLQASRQSGRRGRGCRAEGRYGVPLFWAGGGQFGGCDQAGFQTAPSSTTLTWAATTRQPSGKRTQVCIWRPTLPGIVGR